MTLSKQIRQGEQNGEKEKREAAVTGEWMRKYEC